MNERFIAILKLASSHILLILTLPLVSVFFPDERFLLLSISQTVLFIVFLTGYWEFFGLRFRRIFCGGIELIILILLAHQLYRGFRMPVNLYATILLSLAEIYLLFLLIRILVVIFKKDSLSVEIGFPFSNGNYLITDGGNSRISRLMNYHYYSAVHRKKRTNLSMLYATDMVKIRDGKPTWLPLKNEDYAIFGSPVYSPISGTVVKVVSDIPENEPWSGNYPYNTGNTVVIQKDIYFLLLGHLKKDSIIVNEGAAVKAGDLIASAGNSGWTERPHLHLQLIKCDTANYWLGTGVCMRYNNMNLYKNQLISIA